jgi:TolB-like protein
MFAQDAGIKRTIAIIPFINQNNLKEFDYLKDTLRDSLKSQIIKSDQFLLADFAEMEKEINKMNVSPEETIKVSNAKSIAVKTKSDIVITGKYLIINEEIMVQMDAYDIFTGLLVDSSSIKGDVGLDIFRIVDEVTKDMSGKLVKKLQKVDKTYFDEMTRILNKQKKKEFNNINKAGIGMISGGGAVLISGIIIFTVDNTYILDKRNKSANFTEYEKYYYTDIALFSTGLSLMIIGGSMCITSIPLFVYKKKKLSFNVNQKDKFYLYFSYQF